MKYLSVNFDQFNYISKTKINKIIGREVNKIITIIIITVKKKFIT